MLIGILEIRHAIQHHSRYYLFSAFVVLTWLIWGAKVVLSRRYRPWTEPYETTTSVVIPVVDEPLDLFRDVLRTILDQQPTEVIVVINGPRNPDLERVCEQFAPDVVWTWTPIAGKRNAVRVGVERAAGEIVLLVDSDTVWTPGTLAELVKPFADPTVGGVTTRQRILDPRRTFLTRWADWLENSRALYAMPAQSVLGTVGCLPGRTIAFRHSVLVAAMDAFMHQKFLGVFMEVSDDRTLTNLTLKQGYRTVYQSTSLVYTDAPTRLKKLVKQQFRWARGSQYNTLRMMPWMVRHAPVLAFFFLCDILLPFLWLCTAISWLVRAAVIHDDTDLYSGLLHVQQHAVLTVVALTVLTSALAMCLRQARHVAEVPVDFLWMPLYILFSTVVLMPIRIYGFLRCGHPGTWGTRAHAYDSAAAPTATPSPAPPAAGPGGESPTEPLTEPVAEPVTDAGAEAGAVAVLTRSPAPAAAPGQQSADGDPRALIPYLLATAAIVLGVLYDIRPV